MDTEIIVAIIGAVATIVVAVIAEVRRSAKDVAERNTAEHLVNKAVLERIEGKVDAVGDRLTEHIEWHLDGTLPPRKDAA